MKILRRRTSTRRRSFRAIGAGLIAMCLLGIAPRTVAAISIPTFTVFAAASLTEAFTVLGKIFETQDPNARVTFNFAGSQQLALQIEQGAQADLFASADDRWMIYLQKRGLLMTTPVEFVRNRLVVIYPRSNPGQIAGLQDLARPGVKLVIETDAVPAGHYFRQVLAKLAKAPGVGADYAQRVLHNVVSEEDNVKAAVAKVQLGEADAGVVYRSDVTAPVEERVQILSIPDPYNVIATYPMAIPKGAAFPATATQFARMVLSPLGQQILRGYNLLPAP
ncbi:MAG TPA: molybdate ABC transporter substrate-binding protein [bacterium]|nr:molybdate ABC transporter substrate-binding protein [bacterium]